MLEYFPDWSPAILSGSDPNYYTVNSNTNEHKLHLLKFAPENPSEADLHHSHKWVFKFWRDKTKLLVETKHIKTTQTNHHECAQKTLNGAKFSPASALVSVKKLLAPAGAQMNFLEAPHSCETRLSKRDPERKWWMSNTCPLHFMC